LLLTELAAPASTAELARRTGLSAGAVSQHLGVLKAAALVNRHRAGRHVLYVRTSLAESLVAGAGEVDC
ncbi:ArsR/SmtB family transcription factor, partial [Amycolatopsis mediterranei]